MSSGAPFRVKSCLSEARLGVMLAAALLPSVVLAFNVAATPRATFETRAISLTSRPPLPARSCRMQEGDVAAPDVPEPAVAAAAFIEFIIGVPEPCVPDVQLTRSRDGSTGVATFTFDNPSFLAAASEELGETSGAWCFSQPRPTCSDHCARIVQACT